MLRRYLPRHLLAPDDKGGTPPAAPTQPDATKPPETPPASGGNEPAKEGAAAPGEGEDKSAAPEEPPAPVFGKDDPLLQALLSDYKDETKPVEPAPETPPADQKKEGEEKTTTTPDDKKGEPQAKPQKKRVDILPPEDDYQAPTTATASTQPALPPPPQEPAATNPKPTSDEEYISSLSEEQRVELEEAEHAERLMPEKHKDRRKKLVAYYKKLDETSSKLLSENAGKEGYNIYEDPAYRAVDATKPKMDQVDLRKVVRHMGTEDVQRKLAPELSELKRSHEEMALTPKLNSVANNFSVAARDMIAADEKSPLAPALKLAMEKGIESARETYPLETAIITEEGAKGRDMAREYVRIVSMSKKGFNVFDDSNPLHNELIETINREGELFQQHGGELRIRDGKKFLPRQDYVRLRQSNPAEAGKYWTFSDQDVLGIVVEQTKVSAEKRIAKEEEAAKKRGFVRAPKTDSTNPPKTTKPEPQQLNPPKAQPSAAKGPSSNKPTPPAGEIDVKSTLGY